jgi:hypothetical protein
MGSQHGWVEVPPDRKGFLIFRKPAGADRNGNPLYQFVPDSEEADANPLRLLEFWKSLSNSGDSTKSFESCANCLRRQVRQIEQKPRAAGAIF